MSNEFLEELFYIFTFSFLPFIIHYFFSNCFTFNTEKKLSIVLFYILYLACSIALRFSPIPGLVQLIMNIGFIMLLSFIYRGSFIWRVCAVLFIVALIVLCDVVMPLAYSTQGYIINLFLSKLLMLMLVLIFIRITKAYGDSSLSWWYWVFLFFCPLISIFGIALMSSNIYFQRNLIIISIISSGLLIINFLIFILCDRVLYAQFAQNKSQLLEQQNAYYVNQYLMLKETQEETFKFRHDYKNVLLGLLVKLQSGEEDKGISELNTLLGNIENIAGVCNSGNIIIDSIINYKHQTAEKYQIHFSFDLNIPSNLELDTTVISVILGNILDNAIDACKEKENIQPYIKVHMQYLNESLFIRVQNPFTNEIRTNLKGEICSTKSDRQTHGIGLKSIKKIIDECSGLLNILYDNSLFQVEIVLFNIRRGNQES